MSFILDALRKAEHERRLKQTPQSVLNTITSALPQPPQHDRPWPWRLILLVVLVVNFSVLGLALLLRPAWFTPLLSRPAITQSVPVDQTLPALNIDIHVFSETPERRFVLINGRRYHQGDWLSEGPLLESIDVDSVTLSYQQQRFTLTVKP